MAQFLNTEALFIGLLLVAIVVAIAVRRLRIPYTVALVIVGLILASQSTIRFTLTPELILALFVPPLVFEAAFHLNFQSLQRTLPVILLLAVPGVVITMLIVGITLYFGASFSLPSALVFGALISATDPVAVVALFKTLGVPKPLATLLEGESLLNDGTAIVLYNLMLVVAVTGQFNLLTSIADFLRVSIGGVVIGLLLGWAVSRWIARIDDYLIETTLTTVLAYGAYLLAEQLHFSGVLAVVAAGLVNGNLGPQGMSPTTRIVLFNFWEYIAFLANSLIFLLIGLQVDLPSLAAAWRSILWAIGAVVIGRFLVIYGFSWVIHKLHEPVPRHWRPVLAWGGLRGALSLALALSLPASLGDRTQLLTMAFGVVLFTLLIQATTISSLIQRLKIIARNPAKEAYQIGQAELLASRAALAHLEHRYKEGLISAHAWGRLRSNLQDQQVELTRGVRSILQNDPTLEAEELENAQKEILRAKRSAYLGLRRDGLISQDIYELLNNQVDSELQAEQEKASVEGVGQELGEALDDLELQELMIEPGSSLEGRQIRHIAWPENFIIARIKRNNQVLFPTGNTPVQAGDNLVVVADEKAFQEAQRMSQAETSSKT